MKKNINKSFITKKIDPVLVEKLFKELEPTLTSHPTLLMPRNVERILKRVNYITAEHYGVHEPELRAYTRFSGLSGSYDNEEQSIYVNTLHLKDMLLNSLSVYFHEFGHHLQVEALRGNFKNHQYTKEQLKLLELNSLERDYVVFGNYILGVDGPEEVYTYIQPLEKDAVEYGYSVLFEIFDKYEKVHGNNKAIDEFKPFLEDEYVLSFPTDKSEQEYLNDIHKIWDFKERKNEELKNKIANVNNLPEIDLTTLESMFEYFTWQNLTEKDRMNVLQEYENRFAVEQNREPYTINEDSDISMYSISYNTLDDYFNFCFHEWIKEKGSIKRWPKPKLVKEIEEYEELKKRKDSKLRENVIDVLRQKFVYENFLTVKDAIFDNVDGEKMPDPHYRYALNLIKENTEKKLEPYKETLNRFDLTKLNKRYLSR